jgi:hypothetical protein
LLLGVAVILSPLRAVAATFPMLIAYDAAVGLTPTTLLRTHDAVRRESEQRPTNTYDPGRVSYDDASNPLVVAGAGAVCAYDDALEHDRREVRGEGAVYGAAATAPAAEAAPEAADAITEGIKVYRVFGGEATPFGNPAPGSWTTVDPATVENFREAAGLFPGNTGRFVVEGELTSTEGVTVRASLPGPGGVGGGLPEVVIPNASQVVNVTRVSGVNPEF